MTEPPNRPASTLVPAPSAALAERRAKLVSRGLREVAAFQLGQIRTELAQLIEQVVRRDLEEDDISSVRARLLRDPALVTLVEAPTPDLFGFGPTALHYAAITNNVAMATRLLDAGFDPSARNGNGETAVSPRPSPY
jgi:hypothetical protein